MVSSYQSFLPFYDGSGTPSASADGQKVAFHARFDYPSGLSDITQVYVGATLVNYSSTGALANLDSFGPSLSGDARFVAFGSRANNLVLNDTNGQEDIFLRDIVNLTTSRLSTSSTEGEGNLDSKDPSVSGDGRYTAFYSWANNLVPGDTNAQPDIFVKDRISGALSRVSVSSSGVEGNSFSYSPSISSDGRFVAFYSNASNLVAGDTNGRFDVFVRDMWMNTTTRVSVSTDGLQGDGDSTNPSISGDGRFIAFESKAATLVSGDLNSRMDIFVHDQIAKTTMIASKSASDGMANDDSSSPAISSNGAYVAFASYADNITNLDAIYFEDVFRHELPIPSVITDSENAFCNLQGIQDWQNGYYVEPSLSPSTFTVFPNYGSVSGEEAYYISKDFDTAIGRTLMRPNGAFNLDSTNTVHWPVRRYTAQLAGQIYTRLQIKRRGKKGDGNGFRSRIFRGNTPFAILSITQDVTSTVEKFYSFNLAAGEKIDFAIDPIGNDDLADDASMTVRVFRGQRVRGALVIQGRLTNIPAGQPVQARVEYASSPAEIYNLTMGDFGRFEFTPVGPSGPCTIYLKTGTGLRLKVPVTLGSSPTEMAPITLINGDCDGNNYVGTDDYLIINSAFDKSQGESGFDPRADLNGDNYVGTDDYLILNENFDMSGD